MKRFKKGWAASLAIAFVAMAITTVGVIYSPTLYRMFCAATGYGGTTRRALKPVAAVDPAQARTIKVRFDANVAPGLDWDFKPAQREVIAKIGEPTQVFYTAHNRSNKTIVARATYNVTPGKVAQYFFKVECFCFTNERLGPGESARMPLIFYVDQQFLKDRDTRDVPAITLSYTFFKQPSTPETLASARDLAKGSQQEIAEQAKGGQGDFSAEVRRR
jgi:cytochrome c oxidase assembly protein subunit 11